MYDALLGFEPTNWQNFAVGLTALGVAVLGVAGMFIVAKAQRPNPILAACLSKDISKVIRGVTYKYRLYYLVIENRRRRWWGVLVPGQSYPRAIPLLLLNDRRGPLRLTHLISAPTDMGCEDDSGVAGIEPGEVGYVPLIAKQDGDEDAFIMDDGIDEVSQKHSDPDNVLRQGIHTAEVQFGGGFNVIVRLENLGDSLDGLAVKVC